MRFHREQYLDLMTFGHAPRPMLTELFGPLVGLADEWRAQGASEDEISMVAFDWDFVPNAFCGGYTWGLGPPAVTLHETAEELVQRDFLGRTMKLLKKTATIPLPMDFPVQTMDDWLRVKHFFAFTPDRIKWDEVEKARRQREEGALVVAHMPGAFDIPRELMGEEVACIAYYDQPELMADIVATISDTAFRVLEAISAKVPIDQLSVHEDFAGMVARFGQTTALVGSAVDCRDLTFGTWETVKAGVDRTLELARTCRGVMLAVGNHLPANIPAPILDQYRAYVLAHRHR